MISSTYEFTISLVFPYLVCRIFFASLYPSVVKGSPSIHVRIFGSTNSFKYENFITSEMSVESILEPLKGVITSLGSFADELFVAADSLISC